MTDVPPQDQPPIDDILDDTEHADRTRRVMQPPSSLPDTSADVTNQAAATRRQASSGARARQRRRSQGRSAQRQPQSRSSAARAAPPPPTAVPASYAAPAPVQQPRRARRPTAPPPSPPPSASGLYLPWWSLVVMVMVVGGIAFGMVFVFAELSEPQTPGDQPPRIQIITSQPTLSQDFGAGAGANQGGNQQGQGDFWPTPIPQVQPSATVPLPTPVPSPSLPPGNFVIGARVMVVGVGTSGLNVRSAPGLAGAPLFLAIDDETYAIVDGPQTADGLEWWKIEDPNDPSRSGWAARNYLTVQ